MGEEFKEGEASLPTPTYLGHARPRTPTDPIRGPISRFSRKWASWLSMALYFLYHLDIFHYNFSAMRDCRFFLMVPILGLACRATCGKTGSAWPGAIMHWFWVWIWLNFLMNPELA